MHLKGSHAELNTEAQVNVDVVGQEAEEHVVGSKQRDEEEGGLGQAPAAQKQRDQMQLPASYLRECVGGGLI